MNNKQEHRPSTDEFLVALTKAGNSEAFEELMRRHKAFVYRVIYRMLHRHEDSEDVLQDTFLRAYTKIETFNGGSRFSTWLTRIAINSTFMYLRSKQRRMTLLFTELECDSETGYWDVPSSRPSPEAQVSEDELLRLLRAAVNGLPPRLRTVIQLHNADSRSIAEIAEVVGISSSATKSRLLRARRMVNHSIHQQKSGDCSPLKMRPS
jgi:RNA polymerase sigma-70 factor (ECF subfamily)